jgi:hydrogenase maturation protease
MLREHPRLPPDVTVIEGGTLGLELLPYLQRASRILFLDAIDSGEAPATVIELREAEITGLKGSWSVHQLGFADLLSALKLLRDDEPEVVLIGVQPKSTEWGIDLSPEVNAAMAELTETAINCLVVPLGGVYASAT